MNCINCTKQLDKIKDYWIEVKSHNSKFPQELDFIFCTEICLVLYHSERCNSYVKEKFGK